MPILLSAGAGAYEAGAGPAGHDPPDAPSAVTVSVPVEALYFDPFDRVYLQNADLTMVAGTGPIQRAAHLLLPYGALPATATSGLDVDSIRRASPARRQRAIEDAIRATWKTLIRDGQIRMGAVTLEPGSPWSGRFFVEVEDLVTERASSTTDPTIITGKV